MSAIQKSLQAMNAALSDGGYLCEEIKRQLSEAIQALQSLEGEQAEYTQGICGDGAAILKDGQPMRIEEILSELRFTPQPSAVPDWVKNLKKLAKAATKGPWHGGHGACMDAVAVDYRNEHGNMTRNCFTKSGGAKLVCKANPTAWRPISQVRNDMEFIAAANPVTVLLLISMLTAAQQGGDKA